MCCLEGRFVVFVSVVCSYFQNKGLICPNLCYCLSDLQRLFANSELVWSGLLVFHQMPFMCLHFELCFMLLVSVLLCLNIK